MTTHELSPLVAALNMQPHVEGGWYKEEWKASYQIPSVRSAGYILRPTILGKFHVFPLHAHEISEWHTVLSDELWLWHSGSPVELKLGGNEENPENEEVLVLGMDIAAGQSPQVLVPAGVWQTAVRWAMSLYW